MEELLNLALKASLDAGKEILDVYGSGSTEVWEKQDRSPLTEADLRSHRVIMNYLRETGYPILSEEGKDIPYEERRQWSRFWLVDPLDGTKEFLKRNGEFTVNVALVENGKPILGVVHAPALGVTYFAGVGKGAFKVESEGSPKRLPLFSPVEGVVRVVASRSHLSEETERFVESLKGKFERVEFVAVGSSLKLCMVAEGKADIYPRFAPTMEWDTAAGQAIVEGAGGRVVNAQTGKPLLYNKENLLNPYFIAYRGGYEL
ncbi:3'(2'),5'-bisphosphate nucleotidase CysQ [Thermovibrio ammonificans]